MRFPWVIVSAFIWLNVVSHEGRSQKITSPQEDNDIEAQLKILNKPPIRTIKDKYGSIIDCIDIYKQPAFDHPLLKNHTLQLRPSALPKGLKIGRKNIPRSNDAYIKEAYDCPSGTVPFRRTQKEDLIRAKSVLESIRRPKSNLTSISSPYIHYAVITTPAGSSQKYYGAKTSISVYNLSRVVKSQFSEAMLWIGTGTDGPYNSLEYGWMVHPRLYGDSLPRTYSFWTADGEQKTGCYNALCPGYVQVSKKRIMGEVNHPVTVFGKDVYAMEFMLFKDPKTGIWWLYENLADKKGEPVGYWPKELFPSMDSASMIQIGGKVYGPPGTPTNPPMGSGSFYEDDFTRTCYASNIEFVNSENKFYTPENEHLLVDADSPNVYKAEYLGDATKSHPGRGYTFLFGGPNIRRI